MASIEIWIYLQIYKKDTSNNTISDVLSASREEGTPYIISDTTSASLHYTAATTGWGEITQAVNYWHNSANNAITPESTIKITILCFWWVIDETVYRRREL